jgi:RNA polymerase sigma-70 factor (ECF subfamily)
VTTGDAIELAVRSSYGRLVAYLAVRSRDIAAAEDALGDALVAAFETWPRDGIPDKPEAWLLSAARRKLIDQARHGRVQHDAVPDLRLAMKHAQEDAGSNTMFPDDRLKLLFACAHPAIDESMRTPLMLQAVLGLDAKRIGSAFLVSPATMGQRLVRVKTKIRDAGIRLEIPERHELAPRLDAVLDAIYAAYGSGWDDVAGADAKRRGLAEEAMWLGRLIVDLVPDEPEARGLLALMLYCEARRAARRDPDGRYVPLTRQNVRLWSQPMIEEAERHLATASRRGRLGRFQLEAAIQSVHGQRAATGRTDWDAVALLYEGLLHVAATIGARVAHAAALAEARGAEAGLAALDTISSGEVDDYQPYWALRAHLLGSLGRSGPAAAAFTRAIGLSEDTAVRNFLVEESSRVAATE